MRIATSTIYSQQTAAIDNQSAQYATLGQELSSGKSLSEPSDDPGQIAQDLQLHDQIAVQTQQGTNTTDASNQLTQTDSALSGLTSVLQSANQLAVEAASSALDLTDRSSIVSQLNELISQAVSYGNSEYDGTYIFAGTGSTTTAPVQAVGNPPTAVTFSGNEASQGQILINGENFSLSTTFQSAFNYNAADGSPSVFQTLINLRNQIQTPAYSDDSQAAINANGQVVYGAPTGGAPASTLLSDTAAFATAPVPGGGGGYTLAINGVDTAVIPPGDAIDGAAGSVVSAINAITAQTGVTATYNETTQSMSLTSASSFTVADASGGGNLTEVLNLAAQGDTIQPISTQLGAISNALNVTLTARSAVGAKLQALSAVSGQLQTDVTDNTNVEAGIEDTNVATATTAFTATQTALEAAYSTTTRLEQQTLFSYLS
ncbi:MAG: flagellar hook-associated protein FlgL [Vulcanimicrobiaceae bacterium]|jgi:flagellar hook-associated protein 3 FlgL